MGKGGPSKEGFAHSTYALRNVWLPDGTWVGQFIDADTAKEWLKSKGYDPKDCEISQRKVEFKRPT